MLTLAKQVKHPYIAIENVDVRVAEGLRKREIKAFSAVAEVKAAYKCKIG